MGQNSARNGIHAGKRRAAVRLSTALFLGLTLSLSAGQAQQLTDAQKSAIRSSCRSDYIAHCMSVRPGGKKALLCLDKNMASLSPACQQAVKAALPPPPPAAAAPPPPPAAAAKAVPPPAAPPPKAVAAPHPRPVVRHPAAAAAVAKPPPKAVVHHRAARQSALNAACGNDYLAHCANVPPGGKAALACLRRHAMALSVPCKRVLSRMTAPPPVHHRARPKPVRIAPPPAAAPPPPPPVAQPTRQQLHSLIFTCRRDYRLHCRGVPPNGVAAFTCLARHIRRLTPNCRTSVRAVELSLQAAPPPPPVAVARPSPAAVAARVANLPLREKLAIARACERDRAVVCPGVRPGGGRLLICLASHPLALSPYCRGALARVLR